VKCPTCKGTGKTAIIAERHFPKGQKICATCGGSGMLSRYRVRVSKR
jgi:DnaJ-class molecular chaperone